MSELYNYFVMCWQGGTGTVSSTQLAKAVTLGFITAEEKAQIEALVLT